MTRLRSLTARLTLIPVALVTLVSLLLGTATTLVMDRTLTDRLDQEVQGSLTRALGAPPAPDGTRRIDLRNQAPGTLIAVFDSPLGDDGRVLGDEPGESSAISTEVLDQLRSVPANDEAATVSLEELGDYRVVSTSAGGTRVVVGLPTGDVEDALEILILTEVALGLLAVAAAGGIGVVVVRRQLRPLRRVAATAQIVSQQPLAEGEVRVTERVPDQLTDSHTEVGQVGAALNSLLAHVESSLTARHRSEQQVRQFVADASHELRTPLATIRGYTELAQQHPNDAAAVREALGRVEVESGRMATLVEDLLLLARLDAGRPLAREPVDLTRLLLEGVADARVRAPGHTWRLELPHDPVVVTGDEPRLHQVVTNLLANAATHTPPGTTVTVSLDGNGFVIHDDGPGFDPALMGRAFERFTRGDVARTREPGSNAGLGLAVVEAIVSAHDGRVSIESHPGDTRVRVELPRPDGPGSAP